MSYQQSGSNAAQQHGTRTTTEQVTTFGKAIEATLGGQIAKSGANLPQALIPYRMDGLIAPNRDADFNGGGKWWAEGDAIIGVLGGQTLRVPFAEMNTVLDQLPSAGVGAANDSQQMRGGGRT